MVVIVTGPSVPTPELKKPPTRDGLRSMKRKDVGSKKGTREVFQDREKGVKR